MRKAMEFESEGNSGEHTEALKELDEKALEEPELVNSIDARLKNLRKLESELDESDSETESPIPEVPDDDVEEDDDQAADEDDLEDDSKAEDVEDSKDGPVTIPEAYVRAAIHQEWKQDDIDELIKQNPELALKTFSNCYNSVNNATKEWSAIGRAKIEEERRKAEADVTVPDSKPDIEPLLEKLRESYGNDPLVETVAKLLEQNSKAAEPKANDATRSKDLYATATERANKAADASTDTRINTFFNSDGMKPYEEFYGKLGLSQSVRDLTNGQQEHRLSVLEEAECILTGYRMRGIEPSIESVLEKAHLVVTEPIREQVIRDGLKSSAKKREKGMTFRPSKSKKTGSAVKTTDNAKPKTRQELVNKVSEKMNQVFSK